MRYAFSNHVLDTEAHTLTCGGAEQKVEPQVFDLLCLLIENAGMLVTRDQLVDEIWGGRIVSESAISARIAATRKAVSDDGKRQEIIRTIARRGLQFVADVTETEESQPVLSSVETDHSLHARVRYTHAPDGGQIAWAVTGEGPPVMHLSFVPSHVELDLKQPDLLGLIQKLSDYSVIRYDPRGCGLSDWNMPDLEDTLWAEDIGYVADAAGLERFPIIARSGGVLSAVHFAARYLERVSCLILQGGYVDGRSVREGIDYDPDKEPIEALIKEGWGKPDSPFMDAYGSIYLPSISRSELRETMTYFNMSTSAENALRVRRTINTTSLAPVLSKVKAPTLIVHSSQDAVHPVSEARKLAAGIKNSEMIVLDSPNSILLFEEPAWGEFVGEARSFLKQHA